MGETEQGSPPPTRRPSSWGWGKDFSQKHGGRAADGTTKSREPSSRDFLWLNYREPAGRKERLWQGLNLDSKHLNLDHTSRKTLGNG